MTTYVCNPKTGRAIEVGGVTYKKINKIPKWKRKIARFPKSSSKKRACQVCGINETTNRCNRNFSHNQPHLCKLGPKGYCRKKNLRDKIKLESIVEAEEASRIQPDPCRSNQTVPECWEQSNCKYHSRRGCTELDDEEDQADLKRLWDERVQEEADEESSSSDDADEESSSSDDATMF